MTKHPWRLVPSRDSLCIEPSIETRPPARRPAPAWASWLVVLALALAAVFVPGCASGPRALGRTGPAGEGSCDRCALQETAPTVTAQDAASVAAASAAARGGQEASNQPVMSDTARLQPATVWNRGSGPNSNSTASTDVRSQAGAPSVNQGLILPTSASAHAAVADNPGVKALVARLEDLRAAWRDAVKAGNQQLAASIDASIGAAEARLLAASTGASSGTTWNVYDLRGSTNIQTVGNGSRSGDGPAGAMQPDAIAEFGKGAGGVVDAATKNRGPIAPGPVSGLPPLPPAPEAGAPTPAAPAPELPR